MRKGIKSIVFILLFAIIGTGVFLPMQTDDWGAAVQYLYAQEQQGQPGPLNRDSDGDGVPDVADLCEGPQGPPEHQGCPSEQGAEEAFDEGGGFFNDLYFGHESFGQMLAAGFAHLANFTLSGAGWLAFAGGVVMNMAIGISVVSMSDIVNMIPSLNTVWTVVRDLANIGFIFALLFIGIGIILRLRTYGTYKLLPPLIIAALLINFSMFFAKAVIDVGNVLALQFYRDGLQAEPCFNTSKNGNNQVQSFTGLADCGDSGLSEELMNTLRIQSIYGGQGQATAAERFGQADSVQNEEDDPVDNLAGALDSYWQAGLVLLVGAVVAFVAAFVFFAAGIMFIGRLIILLILIMLSPIGFAAMALPATRKWASDWWGHLIRETFFAPAFLLSLWMVFAVLNGVGDDGGGISGMIQGQNTSTFRDAVTSGDPATLAIIINFIIAIGLFMAALIIGRKFSGHGASFAIDYAQKARRGAQGMIGRSTVGNISNKIANSELMRKFEGAAPQVGGTVRRGVARGANLKFQSQKGYEKALEQRKKNIEGTLEHAGKDKFGQETDESKARKRRAQESTTERGKSAYAFRSTKEVGRKMEKERKKEQEKEEKKEAKKARRKKQRDEELPQLQRKARELEEEHDWQKQGAKEAEQARDSATTETERLARTIEAQDANTSLRSVADRLERTRTEIRRMERELERDEDLEEMEDRVSKAEKEQDGKKGEDKEKEDEAKESESEGKSDS